MQSICGVAVLLLVPFANPLEAAEPLRAVSIPYPISISGAGDSYYPVFSPDRDFLVFTSTANNLVDLPDTNRQSDLFLRDLELGLTTLLTVRADGTQAGNGHSDQASVSWSGRRVVFASTATALRGDTAGRGQEIYAKYLLTGELRWASRRVEDFASGEVRCYAPVLAEGGGYGVFLGQSVTQTSPRLFYYDVEADELSVIATTGIVESAEVSISADGQFVVFVQSGLTRRWDAVTRQSESLLVNPCRMQGEVGGANESYSSPAMNRDGSVVAWVQNSAACSNVYVAWMDFTAGAANWLTPASDTTRLQVSPQGSRLAFDNRCDYSIFNETNRTRDVYVVETGERVPRVISRRHPDRPARTALAMAGGSADTLISANGCSDIFAVDLWRGTTMLLSRSYLGVRSGRGRSFAPVLAGDGRTVVFHSFADDLVEGDYNLTRDVFMLRLGGEDRDGDGMEDEWEMAYFETLDRDGTRDFDGDGVSDRTEFQSGTNPTDDRSLLAVERVATIHRDRQLPWSNRVSWRSKPGSRYQVEYRTELGPGIWTVVAEEITAQGLMTSYVHTESSPGAPGQGYYRVRLLE